jgi:hypothetical protein
MGSTTDGTFEDWDVLWSDAWSNPGSPYLWVNSSYRNKCMSAYLYSGAYFIARSYLFFDLSSIPLASTIKTVTVTCIGKYAANTPVVIQQGTQHEPIIMADYNAFTGNYFAGVVWQKMVDANPNPNNLILDAAGRTYVSSCLGGVAKFCLREYTHDYRNIAPTISTSRNGMHFANHLVEAYRPCITITYK